CNTCNAGVRSSARYSRRRERFVFAAASAFLHGRTPTGNTRSETCAENNSRCKTNAQREAGGSSCQTAADRQRSGRLVALARRHSLSSALDRTKLPRGRLWLGAFRTKHHRSLHGEPARNE